MEAAERRYLRLADRVLTVSDKRIAMRLPLPRPASVISLLHDSNHRRRSGTAARTLVQENYSWPMMAEGFSRVLQDVLGQ